MPTPPNSAWRGSIWPDPRSLGPSASLVARCSLLVARCSPELPSQAKVTRNSKTGARVQSWWLAQCQSGGMAKIAQLQPTTDSLVVTWDDQATSTYPWLWLRDHAHDEATLHPVTQQRQLYTAGLDPQIVASSASVDGGELRLAWPDGSCSTLPVGFLAKFRQPAARRAGVDSPRAGGMPTSSAARHRRFPTSG